jgi:hypothetical protein
MQVFAIPTKSTFPPIKCPAQIVPGTHRPFEINMKEIVGEKAVVAKDKIYKEIKLGRIAGPFHFPPFPTIRISPISVIY